MAEFAAKDPIVFCPTCGEIVWITDGHLDHPTRRSCRDAWAPAGAFVCDDHRFDGSCGCWDGVVAVRLYGPVLPDDVDHPFHARSIESALLDYDIPF